MKALATGVAFALLLSVHAVSGRIVHSGGTSLQDAIGQPVYDFTGTKVGSIRRIVDIKGKEAVVISASPAFAPGEFLVTINYLQPRAGGGWLVALSDSSIGYLRLYEVGQGVPPDFSS